MQPVVHKFCLLATCLLTGDDFRARVCISRKIAKNRDYTQYKLKRTRTEIRGKTLFCHKKGPLLQLQCFIDRILMKCVMTWSTLSGSALNTTSSVPVCISIAPWDSLRKPLICLWRYSVWWLWHWTVLTANGRLRFESVSQHNKGFRIEIQPFIQWMDEWMRYFSFPSQYLRTKKGISLKVLNGFLKCHYDV